MRTPALPPASPAIAMASLLRQMQSKAAVATEIATKRGSAFYRQLMEENKHYVVEPASVEKCQELSKQLFYTRLARFVVAVAAPDPPRL